ncbi:hypothetical protein GVAV_000667 [Gurleya vavrai]
MKAIDHLKKFIKFKKNEKKSAIFANNVRQNDYFKKDIEDYDKLIQISENNVKKYENNLAILKDNYFIFTNSEYYKNMELFDF